MCFLAFIPSVSGSIVVLVLQARLFLDAGDLCLVLQNHLGDAKEKLVPRWVLRGVDLHDQCMGIGFTMAVKVGMGKEVLYVVHQCAPKRAIPTWYGLLFPLERISQEGMGLA